MRFDDFKYVFFTSFENSDLFVDMCLQDLIFLCIYQYPYRYSFPQKNHLIVAVLLMNLTTFLMNLNCKKILIVSIYIQN